MPGKANNGKASKPPAITVAGIRFTADQVVNVTVMVDGRQIYIGEREAAAAHAGRVGFPATSGNGGANVG